MTLTKTVARRRPTAEIVEENSDKVRHAALQDPLFPALRGIFGETKMIASFSHPAPEPIAREIFGNRVLFETAVRASLVEIPEYTHSFSSSKVLNLAYDFGVPSHRDNWHAPGYNRLALGDFPEVLSPGIPYFLQRLRKKIDGQMLVAVTARTFDNAAEAEARAIQAVMPFAPLAFEGKKGVLEALPVLLQVRENVFNMMGVDHLRESPASGMSGKIAMALQVLEEQYGLPFYRMPLTDQFRHGGYLCGIDGNNMRRPVDVEQDGKVPLFHFRDPSRGDVTIIRGNEIYEWMEKGRVIPTVPTFLLATVVGPQIPQMGGRDWKKYAPSLIGTVSEWAGLDRRDAQSLYLCTEGYDPFRVYYKGSTNASKHFTMSYVTFGIDAMLDALRRDALLVGRYGKLGAEIRRELPPLRLS